MRRVCRHYRWLHSYVLLVCRQHRRPAFVRVAKPRCYPLLSYIGTCCSSGDYIVDLRSYALQNLVGTHGCPAFVHAARLPPLPLATFVRTPSLPSTSSTCVRTHCRTSLVHTAAVHSYTLHICRHYCWLHSYVLLVCRQHRQPAFVRVAEPRWYTPLSYIRTCCTSAAITAGYIRTRCSSAVNIVDLRSMRCKTSLLPTAVLHSYVLLVCRLHHRPVFVRVAEARWYPLLSYIRTRCSYAVNTADLRSYALQNLVGTHRCPTFLHAARLPPLPLATFVRAARLPSTSSTCVRTRCKTSLLPTAVLHLYVLLVCRLHRRPAFVRIAESRRYARLSYIRTCCVSAAITAGYIRTCSSSAVNIVDLRSYALQNLVGTHRCRTFVHAARLPPLPLATYVRAAHLPSTSSTCIRTRSLVPTALLH